MKISQFPAHEHGFYLTRGFYFEVQKPFQKDSLMVTAIKTKSCCKLGVFRSFVAKNLESVGQRAAKLPAIKL